MASESSNVMSISTSFGEQSYTPVIATHPCWISNILADILTISCKLHTFNELPNGPPILFYGTPVLTNSSRAHTRHHCPLFEINFDSTPLSSIMTLLSEINHRSIAVLSPRSIMTRGISPHLWILLAVWTTSHMRSGNRFLA